MILVDGHRQREVDVADRAFSYGDGLFETIAIAGARPCLWDAHMRRLSTGCVRLGLPLPPFELIRAEAESLIAGVEEGVLKLVWSAGRGSRGYARRGCVPTRVLSLSRLPDYPRQWWSEGVVVRWCDLRLASQPRLAGIKHLNRLEQVLARAEWDDPDIAEGFLRDQNDHLIEGTMSNVFVLGDGELVTPALDGAGVAGVMAARVAELAAAMGLRTRTSTVTPAAVDMAEALFLTNSVIGIWPVRRLEDRVFAPSRLVRELQLRLQQEGDAPRWL